MLQADPWYLDNVEGLKPEKEKHEFYVDISPKFGFPLAIRPKFQLNAIIERDEDNLYQEVKPSKKSGANTSKAKAGQAGRGIGMQR